MIFRNTTQFQSVYKSLATFCKLCTLLLSEVYTHSFSAVIAIVLLVATFVFGVCVMRKFGQGLKTQRKTARFGPSQFLDVDIFCSDKEQESCSTRALEEHRRRRDAPTQPRDEPQPESHEHRLNALGLYYGSRILYLYSHLTGAPAHHDHGRFKPLPLFPSIWRPPQPPPTICIHCLRFATFIRYYTTAAQAHLLLSLFSNPCCEDDLPFLSFLDDIPYLEAFFDE